MWPYGRQRVMGRRVFHNRTPQQQNGILDSASSLLACCCDMSRILPDASFTFRGQSHF